MSNFVRQLSLLFLTKVALLIRSISNFQSKGGTYMSNHAMFEETIITKFHSAIDSVASHIQNYTFHANDFTRNRVFTPHKITEFLVSKGSLSTRNELLDFFDFNDVPTNSALIQQRNKLNHTMFRDIFYTFNNSISGYFKQNALSYIAADGSTISFCSNSCFSDDSYHSCHGISKNGGYSMHLNAFYDLKNQMYIDAEIQPEHNKNEFHAFCEMVDRYNASADKTTLFIGDRGYCSYNNMAHVINKNQYFLFRAKDIASKGILKNIKFPDADIFDVPIEITLTRSHSKKVQYPDNTYVRFIDKAINFDYIEHDSYDTYLLSFRVVRFKISENSYECIVTNLPQNEFSTDKIKEIYNMRWSVETSFRKLKYTIGLLNFTSQKPEHIKQEIWTRLIAYNITQAIIQHTVINKNRKYIYQVNFSTATHIIKKYLQNHNIKNIMALLEKELIPIRKNRQFTRLQTAHFRKPHIFLYKAA